MNEELSPEERMRLGNMEADAKVHESRQFFHSLNEEQLGHLSICINTTVANPKLGMYYQGVIAQITETKYGTCIACGEKHDEELATISGQPSPSVEPAFPPKDTIPYDDLMDEYGMEQDDDGSDRVMCKNCGLWYVNLQDRTLRPAGITGCHGCVQKTKTG